MSADRAPQSQLDPAILAQLACPACHGSLQAASGALACVACGRQYPIIDGIPALIAERAIPAAR